MRCLGGHAYVGLVRASKYAEAGEPGVGGPWLDSGVCDPGSSSGVDGILGETILGEATEPSWLCARIDMMLRRDELPLGVRLDEVAGRLMIGDDEALKLTRDTRTTLALPGETRVTTSA